MTVRFVSDGYEQAHNYAWCVSREIKPAAEVLVSKEELDNYKGQLLASFPELKFRWNPVGIGDVGILYMFLYDHVNLLIDLIPPGDDPLRHVIMGYIFGISPRKIQEFIKPNKRRK